MPLFHRRFQLFAFGLISGVLALLSKQVRGADEQLWKNCSTPTTQYVLQVPSSLVRSTSPGMAGCTYQSEDGEFTVEAAEQADSGSENQNLGDRMQKEIELLAGTVTYQTKGGTWFVLSGVTSDGTEYYRKHSTNGERWVTLRITYPHSKHKQYDKWVTRIEKAFVAFGQAEAKPATDQNQPRQGSPSRQTEKAEPAEEPSVPAKQPTSSPSDEH